MVRGIPVGVPFFILKELTANMDFSRIGRKAPVLMVTGAELEEAFRTILSELLAEKAAESQERRIPRREVARRLGVDSSTLWRWDKSGYLKAYHLGASVFYRDADVRRIEDGEL